MEGKSAPQVAKSLGNAKKAMSQGKFGLHEEDEDATRAKEEMKRWKDDVSALSAQIGKQLQFCNDLRSKEELSSLMDDAPQDREQKTVHKFERTTKMDIRRLHELYSERVLQPKKMGNQKPASSYDNAPLANKEQTGGVNMEWDETALQLEEQLESQHICVGEKSQTTSAADESGGGTGRNGKQKSDRKKTKNEETDQQRSYDISEAISLLQIKDDYITSLCDFVLEKKKAIDEMSGESQSASDTGSQLDSHCSRGTQRLAAVFLAFQEMEGLIRRVRLHEETMSDADAMVRLEDENSALSNEVSSLKDKIKDMEYRLTLAFEEQRSSSKGKLMVQNTLSKLDEVHARNRELESQLKDVTSERSQLLSKNGALREQNQALEEKLESLKEELSTKTNWYEPKIEQLEKNVKSLSSGMKDLRTSIELLSEMYQAACDDAASNRVALREIKAERRKMSRKLREEITKVCEYQEELKRQENIQIRLYEANKSLKTSYQELKDGTADQSSKTNEQAHEDTETDSEDQVTSLKEYAQVVTETPHLDDQLLISMRNNINAILSQRNVEK